jgi:cytochrome c-type biogenesis protein
VDAIELLLAPLGLGLLGFIEPCSIGSSLLFLDFLKGRERRAKVAQALAFMFARALFLGLLGVVAAALGQAFLGLQRGAWIALGALYTALGLLYLSGRSGALMRGLGPSLARLRDARGAAALGLLFGFNVPACAAPLLAGLLGAAALGPGTGAANGFVMLAVFGLALSLPLVLAVAWKPAERMLERAARRSERAPLWIGSLLVALGAWSILSGAR